MAKKKAKKKNTKKKGVKEKKKYLLLVEGGGDPVFVDEEGNESETFVEKKHMYLTEEKAIAAFKKFAVMNDEFGEYQDEHAGYFKAFIIKVSTMKAVRVAERVQILTESTSLDWDPAA